jgi:DinB superfamily
MGAAEKRDRKGGKMTHPQPAPHDLGALLRRTIESELPNLRALDSDQASKHPNGPESWSPKQELGHLIDSAANNHIRFVRAGLDGEYKDASYKQNEWVRIHGYEGLPWDFLVTFWHQYNMLLAVLIGRIPAEKFAAICRIGDGEPVPLGFVIEDYVRHMRHHLDHILAREAITAYP